MISFNMLLADALGLVPTEDARLLEVDVGDLEGQSERDPALLDLRALGFDRISITNAGKVIALQREGTNNLWRITEPLSARADYRHLLMSLQKLQGLSISQFVTDNPTADLDSFGLAPPNLSLGLAVWKRP